MSLRSLVPMAVLTLALAGNALGATEPPAFLPLTLTPAVAECSSPALGPGTVPEPIFLSCSAHATCYNGSSVNCTSASGSCTGIDASCPSQRGYVQCGGTTTLCPACPVVGYGCTTVTCQDDAQCTAICPDPEQGGRCQTGCPPQTYIKKCFCLA